MKNMVEKNRKSESGTHKHCKSSITLGSIMDHSFRMPKPVNKELMSREKNFSLYFQNIGKKSVPAFDPPPNIPLD